MSSKELVSFRCRMKVITPIHIGDGKKYTKMDYVYDRQLKKVGILSQQNFFRFLTKENLYNGYQDKIRNAEYDNSGNVIFENYPWLTAVGHKNILERHPELFISILDVPEHMRNLNVIDREIRDVFGNPYIPGSSLKGMLRNAVMADLILKAKRDPKTSSRMVQIWQNLDQEIKTNRQSKARNFAASEISALEATLFREIFDQEGKALSRQLADPFRGILVGDSEPFRPDSTMLCAKEDLMVKAGQPDKSKISLQRESLRPGLETTFRVTLDVAHLKAAGIGQICDAATLFDCVKTYRQSVLDLHEKLLTTKFTNNSDLNYKPARIEASDGVSCVLGGGVGFQSHSLLYALAPDAVEASRVVANLLDKQFPKVHTAQKDSIAAPRTIKTTTLVPDRTYPSQILKEGKGRYKLGICALREVT